ncbi:protein of unknown function DUF262 [Rippkaea orientalis PCC 8801]|uniref:GmrSD restriction endonucleases N-terminal domain-containing protein n=1 Tax=Rippkaea orientalis (strain PCC 8801 / RF-1) TaxID=41431 RepID=B7JWA4_RIPO1|nr:DUF262 domain-containing protein [Rippkaea orientalis]ACK66949.1 protein of unknown function DUF262 [Rippkaea orientalis PCC 8801]
MMQQLELPQINDDEDFAENSEESEFETDKLIYDPDNINIDTKEPTIEQLLRRIDEEALDLAPDFQRNANLWKDEAKSRLIESIIIRIPLPAFYIDATDDDRWIVVDGIQRLSALKQFVTDKKLRLSGLEYLKSLEGKNYDEVVEEEKRYQRRILETQVTVYLINKGTPPEVKYNIFKRINTGGLPMSPQEIRHALNPGKGNRFILKLADSEEFKKVVPLGQKRIMRMDDREFVLAFLAFILTNYQEYKHYPSRNLFLTRNLVILNKKSQEQLDDLEKLFNKIMNTAWNIFGDNAYRKLIKNASRKQPINQALFETWSFWLSQLSEQEIQILISSKEILKQNFMQKIEDDPEFVTSISQASEKVEYRFIEIEKIIREVLS